MKKGLKRNTSKPSLKLKKSSKKSTKRIQSSYNSRSNYKNSLFLSPRESSVPAIGQKRQKSFSINQNDKSSRLLSSTNIKFTEGTEQSGYLLSTHRRFKESF